MNIRAKTIQLNYTLQSGMFITTARSYNGSPRIKIFITDLHNTARATIDIERKELLYANAPIDMSKTDIDAIVSLVQAALSPKK
jgi:hypothetical protein